LRGGGKAAAGRRLYGRQGGGAQVARRRERGGGAQVARRRERRADGSGVFWVFSD